MYTLPVLTYTVPDAARDALCWRHSTLGMARARAAELRLRGVDLPVAHDPRRGVLGLLARGHGGVSHQRRHRGCRTPLRRRDGRRGIRAGPGIELLVETARLWRSLGHHDARGGFRIDGVTGPDEYTRAGRQQRVHQPDGGAQPARGGRLRRSPPGPRGRAGRRQRGDRAWRTRRPRGGHPVRRGARCTSQSAGFTRYRRWDFANTPPRSTRCCSTTPTTCCTAARSSSRPTWSSRCIVRRSASRRAEGSATSRTTRRSPCATRRCRPPMQAIVAAEIGSPRPGLQLSRETALVDLRDLAGNTRFGLHLAASAGTWLVAVAGFGGMRDYGGAPRVRAAPAIAAESAQLSACSIAAAGCGCRSAAARLATSCCPASRSSSITTASSSASPLTRRSRSRSSRWSRGRARRNRRAGSLRSGHWRPTLPEGPCGPPATRRARRTSASR